MGWIGFPVIVTCTLQGSSVTQGNPVRFTAKTFAVQSSLHAEKNSILKGLTTDRKG